MKQEKELREKQKVLKEAQREWQKAQQVNGVVRSSDKVNRTVIRKRNMREYTEEMEIEVKCLRIRVSELEDQLVNQIQNRTRGAVLAFKVESSEKESQGGESKGQNYSINYGNYPSRVRY